jgi:DNA-directed RNA polymerase specialized sigma24 family protein
LTAPLWSCKVSKPLGWAEWQYGERDHNVSKSQERSRIFLPVYELYERKIRTFCRQTNPVLPGSTLEDLEQEIAMVLWKCVVGYDPDQGCKFSTYFWNAAIIRVRELVRNAGRQNRNESGKLAFSLDGWPTGTGHDSRLGWDDRDEADVYPATDHVSAEDHVCHLETVRERVSAMPQKKYDRFVREFAKTA